MVSFLIKILFLVTLAIFVRGILPRYRVDQVMYKNWKIFIFLCLFFILQLLAISYFFT